MPTIKLKSLLTLVSILYLLTSFVPQAQAATDPISATTSATATVARTTPTTSDTTAPTNPILIRPVDGTVTGDNKIEFTWRQSSDPDGNVVIYTLYLNGVAQYLGISNLGNSAGVGYTARLDGSEIKLIPTTTIPDGTYDWYVTASDGSGNSSTSTTWHFTIDTIAPIINLTDVDIYHNLPYNSGEPEAFEGLNFDISGPKDVYLTVESEPWSTLTIMFRKESGELVSQASLPLDQSGLGYPYTHLMPGIYLVSISSYDQGGNASALPDFKLTVTQSSISIPLPGIPGLPPSYNIPYTPLSIPSLPATIAKVQTSVDLTVLTYTMLAIGLLALLIILWYRKYNIIFLNDRGEYLSNIKVYHSIPTTKTHYSPVWMSNREPISYLVDAADRGRLYIKHLSRYSTLTIKTEDKTYVLSLSAKRKLYTLILG